MGCFLSSARSSILPWKEMAKIPRQNIPNSKWKKSANLMYLYSRLLVLVSHKDLGNKNTTIANYLAASPRNPLLKFNTIGYFTPVMGQFRSFSGAPKINYTYIILSIG